MDALKRVTQIFQRAEEISFDDSDKFILMSDCHRGDGNWSDDFSRNMNIYFAALNYYYLENYTYIEIGDGDELWENRSFSDIVQAHSNVFWLLSKFYKEGRLHMIFGNHDMVKKDSEFIKNNMQYYFDEATKEYAPLFVNIKVHEGLVLRYNVTGDKIFLIHGHQVDFINYELWKLSRFLVRYLWRPLSNFALQDPTRAAKNYKKKRSMAKILTDWVIEHNQMLIAGHNHRPAFPETDEPPYFNDGSSVHPRCITGIEIAKGNIILVKWSVKTRHDGTLYIGRDVLAGPRRLVEYFKKEDIIKRQDREPVYYVSF